ncbi:hypothetical protein BURK_008356 [Burkholderia sp. SJ98]|nr:hypothetical protein BURK_008356 [Burkholderia sp. SJ98]
MKGRAVLYAGPRLEVRLGEIVADAVVTTHDRQLIIEVAVEHPVDDEKLRKLAYMQTPAIELEAWRLDRTVDWTKIRSFISESVEGRKWLFNSRAGQLMKEAQAEAQALADAHAQAARRNVTSRDMPRSQTMAGSFGRRGDDTVLTGDWQTDATTKLKRLWHRHRVDRLLTVTPSFAAADMILRWEEKDAHEGDVQSHFESLLAVLATIAHITYRDENGVIVELRQ